MKYFIKIIQNWIIVFIDSIKKKQKIQNSDQKRLLFINKKYCL